MNQLDLDLQAIFSTYSNNIDEILDDSLRKIAIEAKKELKARSPRGKSSRSNKYYRSWYVRKQKASAEKSYGYVVANHEYRLTHLLEYGHDIVKNGKVVGHADAIPHIANVNDYILKELIPTLSQRISQIK